MRGIASMIDKDDKDKKNIIHFPDLEKRKSRDKDSKAEKKKSDKARKEQEKLEEQYRAQYRAERDAKKSAQNAMNMMQGARTKATGKKTPFINGDRIPPFTRAMLILFTTVHCAVFFLLSSVERASLFFYYGFVPALYTGHTEWATSALISPFTSLILHGGWLHLAMNCLMMAIMGIFFEKQYGAKRTAIFFLLCGMGGHLFYLLVNPFSTAPVVGASGAITGLFAATFLTLFNNRMISAQAQERGPVPFILLWSALIVGLGMMSHDVSWQSHLGGFWSGLGLFYLWSKGHIKL